MLKDQRRRSRLKQHNNSTSHSTSETELPLSGLVRDLSDDGHNKYT